MFSALSAAELTTGYARGDFTPVEAAAALLARIKALDGPVNSVVFTDEATTLAQAAASAARYAQGAPLSALDGVPVTIKDLSAVAGWPLWRGSLTRDDTPAEADTPAVARLREAGAVFLAKTATPEGGCKIVTASRRHGATANPYDPGKTPAAPRAAPPPPWRWVSGRSPWVRMAPAPSASRPASPMCSA